MAETSHPQAQLAREFLIWHEDLEGGYATLDKVPLGIEMNLGKAGHQSESRTRDSEQNGIGNANFPGHEREQRDGHETNQN